MAYLTDFMERITELTDIETTSCQYPDLAVLPDGRLAACWQRYHNKHDDIVAAFLSREGEILSQAVVSGEGQAFRPRLYVLNGTVWVIWSESSAGNWKLLARAFGEELGAPILLSRSSGAFYPSVTDDGQNLYVAWCEQQHGDSHICCLRFDGSAAAETWRVSSSEQAYRPAVAFGGDGVLYLAYDVFDGSQYLQVARAYAGGAWGEEAVISNAPDWASDATAVSTDSGATVVWHGVGPRGETNYYTCDLTLAGDKIAADCRQLSHMRVWFASASLCRNRKGTQLLAQALSMRCFLMRWRQEDGSWSVPVAMVRDEASNCPIRPRACVDEEDNIFILYQHSAGNGHQERYSSIKFLSTTLAELQAHDDSAAEKEIDSFTKPIPGDKALDRIDEDEKRRWLDENGYLGLDLKFGDIHGQSGMSDASGQIDQYYNYAKAVPKLDFTALTDHDMFPDVITESEWEYMRTSANEFNKDGELTTLLAYEWTSNELHYDFGHKNVYYRTGEGELFRACHPEGMTPDRLFASIKKYGALCIPHHPAAIWSAVSAATDWAFHDPEVQRAVEIFSRHAPFEKDGTESIYTKNNPRQKGKYVQDALARGYRLGFTAGSDSHQLEHGVEGGIVAAFVPGLTRETLFDAIYNRFTYATTGAGILLSCKVNGARMGSEITALPGGKATLEVDVLGTGELERVEVVKDNGEIYAPAVSGNRCRFTWADEDLTAGTHFYYLRVTQKDQHQAWSSPIWVDVQ